MLPKITSSSNENLPIAKHVEFIPLIQPNQKRIVSSTINLKSNIAKPKLTVLFPTQKEKQNDPSSVPATAQKLDLHALRAQALQFELSRKQTADELQKETKHKSYTIEKRLDEAAQQALHTDCRDAYAKNGLLAPLFIAVDMVSDKGCRF